MKLVKVFVVAISILLVNIAGTQSQTTPAPPDPKPKPTEKVIKCWTCNDTPALKCGNGDVKDTTQGFKLTECKGSSDGEPMCLKQKTIGDDRVIKMTRSCILDGKSKCPETIKKDEFCETCKTDACNHGTTLKIEAVFVLLSVYLMTKFI